ncbi:MAG TPA: GspMb/PilO family protein [Candidatus Acidoferrum sp.]|nr:GspMb/PilO family protein [Candidatus Acidoferrum sp.]
MSAKGNWGRTKTTVIVVLAVLLAADIGVGVFLWRTSRQSSADMRGELNHLKLEARLRDADVARGRKVRASLPRVAQDCSRFYQNNFLSPGTGYSSIDADLSSIAGKAGLRISDTTYKEGTAETHGVKELSITASVEGSYASVIQFINGLEQSRNFYLLNDLQLTSAKGGAIKLNLKLRTFFRA